MKTDTTTPLIWVEIDKAIPRLENENYYPVKYENEVVKSSYGYDIKCFKDRVWHVLLPVQQGAIPADMIEFAKYVINNCTPYTDGKYSHRQNYFHHTMEEIYQLFLKSKQH